MALSLAPPPEERSPAEQEIFGRQMASLTRALAGGRATSDAQGTLGLGSQAFTMIAPPDAESTWRALDLDLVSLELLSPARIAELLCDLSPEVSVALNDFLRFCNPGFEIQALKVGSDDVDERAQKALNEFTAILEERHGSLDLLINRLFTGVFLRGAFFAELVLDERGRNGIDIVIPDPSTVRFRKILDPLYGEVFQLGQWQAGKFVHLDRPTVRYVPHDPFPGVPYGRPVISPAIFLALFNIGLLRDIRRVVAQQGYPRLDVEIDLPKLFESLPVELQDLDTFSRWAEEWVQKIEQQYSQVRPEDAYVHFSAVKINRPIGALDGSTIGSVDGLMKAIERGMSRALKTSPIIMGITEGTSEAQANRQWEIHAARIKAFQHPAETMIAALLKMELNARGIQADVRLRFGEIRSAELQRDAQVENLKITNAKAAFDNNWIDRERAAKDGYDVEPDDLPDEAAPPPQPVAPPTPDAASLDAVPEPGANRSATSGTRHNAKGDHPSGGQFSSAEAGATWAAQSFAGYAEKLTGSERTSVVDYASFGGHSTLNSKLRDGNLKDLTNAEYTRYIGLKSAIAKGTVDKQVVVYRGIQNEALASKFDTLQRGDKFFDGGFVSTSYDRGVVDDFLGVAADTGSTPILMEVYVPKGAHAAHVDPIIADRKLPEQKELLFAPSMFSVLRTERRYDENLGAEVATLVVELDKPKGRRR